MHNHAYAVKKRVSPDGEWETLMVSREFSVLEKIYHDLREEHPETEYDFVQWGP